MAHKRRDWMEDAYCATDPDVQIEQRDGFDRFHDTNNAMQVRAYCLRNCPVVEECTEYAIKITYGQNDIVPESIIARAQAAHGIWGGTSPKQRGKIVEKRKNQRKKIQELAERMKAQSLVSHIHTEDSGDVPA